MTHNNLGLSASNLSFQLHTCFQQFDTYDLRLLVCRQISVIVNEICYQVGSGSFLEKEIHAFIITLHHQYRIISSSI